MQITWKWTRGAPAAVVCGAAVAVAAAVACGDVRAPIAPIGDAPVAVTAGIASAASPSDRRTADDHAKDAWILSEHDRVSRAIGRKRAQRPGAMSAGERCQFVLDAVNDEVDDIARAAGSPAGDVRAAYAHLRSQARPCTLKLPPMGSSLSLFAALPGASPVSDAAVNAARDFLASLPRHGPQAAVRAALDRGYQVAAGFTGFDADYVYATVDVAASSYDTWASYGNGAGPFLRRGGSSLSLFQLDDLSIWGALKADGEGFAAGVMVCRFFTRDPRGLFACGAIGAIIASNDYVWD